MRPVSGKWKPEPEWKGPGGSDADDEVVADTQVGDAVAAQQGGEDGEDIGNGQVGTADKEAGSQAMVGKKDGLVDAAVKSKKAPRKVSSTAHANYRALKIKNKHSKGKAGGKYGRRR
ncbi:DNA replication/checkpoint protein [Lasallia pustulata]|uniref:DNA replication/checkpoint protein n=1 Tax=Lasallia pustulata TaxID=136370 RepID=A0A1W5D1K1_9LECA|nr:DNA replication/checkpoint protein [Lasallia pustulata]